MPTHEKDHHSQNVNAQPKKGIFIIFFLIFRWCRW